MRKAIAQNFFGLALVGYIFVVVPARGELVADSKASASFFAESARLSADSFYKQEAQRDPSWPKKLEIVDSDVRKSVAQIQDDLRSEKIWQIRYHCDGYPFFANEADVSAPAKEHLAMPLGFVFYPYKIQKDSYAIVNQVDFGGGTKYQYRIESRSPGKFTFYQVSFPNFKRSEEAFPARFVEIQNRDSAGVLKTVDTAIEIEGPKMCNKGTKPIRQLLILRKQEVSA